MRAMTRKKEVELGLHLYIRVQLFLCFHVHLYVGINLCIFFFELCMAVFLNIIQACSFYGVYVQYGAQVLNGKIAVTQGFFGFWCCGPQHNRLHTKCISNK